MRFTRTPGPLMRSVAAALSVAAVLSACGGSPVEETAGGTTDAAGSSAVETSPGAGTAQTVDGSVPGPAAVSGSSTTGAGAAGEAPAAGAGTAGAAEPGAAAATKNKGGNRSGGGTAAEPTAVGLAGAVQKLVASSPLFGGTGACKPATLSEVVVGNLSTRSGVLGELFSAVTPALETFVASQNACGGLNGHRIKMVFRDDQGDPSTASSLAQQMIQQDKILAFVGNFQVTSFEAVVPVVKRFGIPVIGGDSTNDTWTTNPLIFPQGSSVQSTAWGFAAGINKWKKTKVGQMWCIEAARSCTAAHTALKEMAPTFGFQLVRDPQVSITQPSYVQQCLDMKNAGVELLVLNMDAASNVRIARSCEQVGFFPETMAHPVGVALDKQFFGNKWLGGSYVPLITFPHIANDTPATKYYQDSVRKYNPGFDSGLAASSAWTSAALLVAAAANLPAQNPTTKDLLDTLYEFRGQDFTRLGGLTASALTYNRDGIPKIPYCLYTMTSDPNHLKWSSYTTKPICTDYVAPSDPLKRA